MANVLARKRLCDLDLPPLSQSADETLRRVRVFLFSAQLPAWQTLLLLAGYSPKEHEHGVFLTSLLSGERSFEEWRQWRSLRPPTDPDLPELVAHLSAFASLWLPRAQAATREVIEEIGDRDEILHYLEDTSGRSETWRAKGIAARLRHMQKIDFYAPVWRALVDQGIEEDLKAFDLVLEAVQAYIRDAELDQVELDEIGRSREDAAREVRKWLDKRCEQLAHLNEEDLAVLALGEVIPPPGFEPPIAILAMMGAGGSA